MDGASDTHLVQRALNDDRAALGQLFSRYRNRVFAVTYHLSCSREDALDASQETFLRAWRYLGKFDSSRPFGPWIRAIAVRAALDQTKRTSKHAQTRTIDPDGISSDQQNGFRESSRSQLLEHLRSALATLSPTQKAAFVCKELEGMNTAETARAMGCTSATVRWHLYQARRALACQLADFRGLST